MPKADSYGSSPVFVSDMAISIVEGSTIAIFATRRNLCGQSDALSSVITIIGTKLSAKAKKEAPERDFRLAPEGARV